MTDTRPNNRIEAPGKPGAELIAELEKLRDSHRLGLHIWENTEPFGFPHVSHETLDKWRPKPAAAHSDRLSISLLPSKADGITLAPYGYMSGFLSYAGYLFDLSEQQANPPSFLAGDVSTLNSGDKANAKRYTPDTVDPSLDDLAARYPTEHQKTNSDVGVADFNELIAYIGHPHVAAIVIPDFDNMKSPDASYVAATRLNACLSALAHMHKGADLPVVTYHVTGPHRGEITYIGKGKDELRRIAAESLKATIEQRADCYYMPNAYGTRELMDSVQNELGIDLRKPLDEQRDAFAKLSVPTNNARDR